MRQLKGKAKETRKEKRMRKKENVENKQNILYVVLPTFAVILSGIVLYVYFKSQPVINLNE